MSAPTSPVACVETFVVTLPRDTPYLGPLGAGEQVNAQGYIVRSGNRTIYPTVVRSILICPNEKSCSSPTGQSIASLCRSGSTRIA